MSFSISFHGEPTGEACEGSISLGEFAETFHADLRSFSRQRYEQQWSDAVKAVLSDRKVVCLFYNVELNEEGYGLLWTYPIVPSELAGDTLSKKKRLENFPDREDDGVYVTERFLNVTVKSENFERRLFWEFEDGSQGEEISLYYLDLSVPERLFGYMNDNIADVSHWYFPNSDLERFLLSR
ncbi:hypothetical protein [Pseudooceanicola sp.]|uniref:hypothetical protein n=1 Tax=Pseudooceanicola sp. TaxID=1914328 RepID=UPI0035112664